MNDQRPSSWALSAIGDVVDVERGVTFPASAKQPSPAPDTVLCLRTSNVQTSLEWDDVLNIPDEYVKNDSKWLQEGDTVISMANSYELVGKVALAENVPARTTFGGFLSVLRPGRLEPKFLFNYMRSAEMRQAMQRTASRTVNIANLSLRGLLPLEVPVAPLNEQRRIVAKLDALQAHSRAAREALDAIPALLDRFRQSVLAAAFRGDLTREWRQNNPDVEPASVLLERIRAERRVRWIAAEAEKARARAEARAHKKGQPWGPEDDEKALAAGRKKGEKKYTEPEPVDAEAEGLPELPEGWCWTSVDSAMTAIVDCPHSTPKYGAGDCYAIDTNSMTKTGIETSKLRRLDRAAFDLRNKRLVPLPNDVVFAREGTVGTAVVLPTHPPVALGQRVMLMRPPGDLSGDIIAAALMSPMVRSQYADKLVGSTVAHVNMRDIRQFRLPLIPLREQSELRRILRQFSMTIDSQAAKFGELALATDTLDQAILAKAFRGELVPQDPNDEPASVLLDRIRAEREAAAKKPKGKRKRKTS